jgi:hypothetical protein
LSNLADENNLSFIPVSDVPSKGRRSKWRRIFIKIPKGQALVLSEDQASYQSVRSSLKNFQDKGEFENLKIFSRRDNETGKRMIYISNPE